VGAVAVTCGLDFLVLFSLERKEKGGGMKGLLCKGSEGGLCKRDRRLDPRLDWFDPS